MPQGPNVLICKSVRTGVDTKGVLVLVLSDESSNADLQFIMGAACRCPRAGFWRVASARFGFRSGEKSWRRGRRHPFGWGGVAQNHCCPRGQLGGGSRFGSERGFSGVVAKQN